MHNAIKNINHQCYPQINNDSSDNFINLNLTYHYPKIQDTCKNLSEIRLKRHSEHRSRPIDQEYKSNDGNTIPYRDKGPRKTISNRGDYISTSSNSRRITKKTHSSTIASKNFTLESANAEISLIENIYVTLKEKLENLEKLQSLEENDVSSSRHIEEKNGHKKLKILGDTMAQVTKEFPKFQKLFSYVEEQYQDWIKEFLKQEESKKEIHRQNLSKIRSLLDSEVLQNAKLQSKVQLLDSKI